MFQYWNKLYMDVTLRWKGARQKFWVFFKSDFHENAISEGFRSIPESLRTQIQHLFFEKRKFSTISKLLFEILGNKTQMSELCHELSTNITIISQSFDFGCNIRSLHNSCNRSRIDSSNRSLGCGRNESRMITPEPTHPRRLSWVRKIKIRLDWCFFQNLRNEWSIIHGKQWAKI